MVYVLLGTDDNTDSDTDIPVRMLHAPFLDWGKHYYQGHTPGDLYYSCLDGAWKNQGDLYYGEPGSEDIGWEVYTGRFPADDAIELKRIIDKTIQYSEEPVKTEIFNNLMCGEFLWGPTVHPVTCYTKGELEIVMDSVTDKNSYTTFGFGRNGSWKNYELWEKDAIWDDDDLIKIIKDNKVTWINHSGHSNSQMTMLLNISRVTDDNFTNDGISGNYFICY